MHFLGQPRFYAGDAPHPFRGRPRTIALLAFLLLHRDAHLPRDMIAFTLWPDDGEEEARGKLRRHLHDLTNVLPASDVPYVRTVGDALGWNAEAPLWFDVDVFENACGDLDRAPEAVALYDGDLLPTVFDDWIFPIRDRLRRTFLTTLERLIVRSRSRRRYDDALAYAERTLAHDPWREDVLRHLAAIQYESGNRAGALRELDAFGERLRAELGVDPMPETTALRGIILRGGALPDAGGSEIADAPAGNGFPFVGRERELETLGATWRRAARGRGELILIGGDAGIGKTRLCSELALVVGTQGGRVLRGTTASPERAPYQAIVEALRDAIPLVAELEVKPVWLAAIATLLPELRAVRDDLPVLPALDDRRESARLRESLASVLGSLARKRPLLLVLEDVHWAGGATIDALEHLARAVAGMPATIVATYRTGDGDAARDVASLRRRLQSENVATHQALGGLAPDAVCALARALPAFAEADDALGLGVHDATGGNPLFACELLRDRAEFGDDANPGRGLLETLTVRASRLSETALAVAETSAVIGVTFDIDLVRDVCGLPESEVFDALAELLERRLVREVGRAGFSFAFAHETIASLVYGAIAEPRRKRLHATAARALERLDGAEAHARAAALARHYEGGGDLARAAGAYARVAEHAFGVYANAEALRACERGLAARPDDATRFALTALHERVCARLGRRDDQERDLDDLDALTNRQADPELARIDVFRRRAALAHARSRFDHEAALLDDLGARASASGDARLGLDVLLSQARNANATARYAAAVQTCARALDRAEELGDVAAAVESLCLQAEAAVGYGEAEGSASALAAARRRAEDAGDRFLVTRVQNASSAAAINLRDFPSAVVHARAALAGYREVGDREGEAEAGVRVASALALSGNLEEGRAAFATAAEIYRTLGSRLKIAYLLFNRCGMEILAGLLDEAWSSATAALAIFEAQGDRRGVASACTNLSMIRLLLGAPDEARDFALRGLAEARAIENWPIEAGALSNLGNAERELGAIDDALAHMREAIAIRRRFDRPATLEELADLALAYLRANDLASALATAAEIETLAGGKSIDEPWPHYSYFAAARVHRAAGDLKGAEAHLARAQQAVRVQEAALAAPELRAAFGALASVRAIARASAGDWPAD